jgi:hypothetical protein
VSGHERMSSKHARDVLVSCRFESNIISVIPARLRRSCTDSIRASSVSFVSSRCSVTSH